MGISHNINERVFRQIHGNSLVYNACWEDPRCDRELLKFDSRSRVVMITSAGCNALDYLLDDPAAIHCVDINPRQNALLQLKMALLQNGDHSALFEFFGDGVAPDAHEIYYDSLRMRMPVCSGIRCWK